MLFVICVSFSNTVNDSLFVQGFVDVSFFRDGLGGKRCHFILFIINFGFYDGIDMLYVQ